jgi:hypothetical protein
MDFTLEAYQNLLNTLQTNGYCFQSFVQFISFFDSHPYSLNKSIIILRHDVDRNPNNSLITSKIENKLGIKASYYFRIPKTFRSDIINQIAELGHEIGYHYENMDTCHGDIDKAWDDFRYKLEKLRKIFPVKTICMHGSPLSHYDNRDLWKKYDYRTEGIIGEPYLDVDWEEVFYLTDTGRCWNGKDISIRDKVELKKKMSVCQENRQIKTHIWPVYHSTKDIITAINDGTFPKKAMITTHPQRWTNNPVVWTKELVYQNIKNLVKYFFVQSKS